MRLSECTPLSPRILYPHVRVSGLGAAVDARSQIGKSVCRIVAGEVEESKEIEAETIDVEDVQPQLTMPTPDLPSRPVIEDHRIDHWPPRPDLVTTMLRPAAYSVSLLAERQSFSQTKLQTGRNSKVRSRLFQSKRWKRHRSDRIETSR